MYVRVTCDLLCIQSLGFIEHKEIHFSSINWKGCARKQLRSKLGNILEELRNTMKNLSQDVIVHTEIRTRWLLNTDHSQYRLRQLAWLHIVNYRFSDRLST